MTESSGLAVASALLRLRHGDETSWLGSVLRSRSSREGVAPVGSTEFGDLALGRH